mmetsp:Transcript_51936/g.101723  ORF Transcript_51936/g.101723 Transcript_51936/m.101723 type:complete len:211 (-) Transcript_51936:96-728(-)
MKIARKRRNGKTSVLCCLTFFPSSILILPPSFDRRSRAVLCCRGTVPFLSSCLFFSLLRLPPLGLFRGFCRGHGIQPRLSRDCVRRRVILLIEVRQRRIFDHRGIHRGLFFCIFPLLCTPVRLLISQFLCNSPSLIGKLLGSRGRHAPSQATPDTEAERATQGRAAFRVSASSNTPMDGRVTCPSLASARPSNPLKSGKEQKRVEKFPGA